MTSDHSEADAEGTVARSGRRAAVSSGVNVSLISIFTIACRQAQPFSVAVYPRRSPIQHPRRGGDLRGVCLDFAP